MLDIICEHSYSRCKSKDVNELLGHIELRTLALYIKSLRYQYFCFLPPFSSDKKRITSIEFLDGLLMLPNTLPNGKITFLHWNADFLRCLFLALSSRGSITLICIVTWPFTFYNWIRVQLLFFEWNYFLESLFFEINIFWNHYFLESIFFGIIF